MKKFAAKFSGFIFRVIPDAFPIAIILTFAVFVSAVLVEQSNPLDVVRWWGDGMWDLLEFTMQIALILVAGYLLAKTPPVDRFLDRATSRLSNPRTAVFVGTLIAGAAMWSNWGFGIVVAGVLAFKLKQNVPNLRAEIMLASGFSTITVYGLGLSGTIPLLLATEEHFLVEDMGVVPLSDTVFRPSVLITAVLLIVLIGAFNALLHPKTGQSPSVKRDETIDRASVPATDTQDRLRVGVPESVVRAQLVDSASLVPDRSVAARINRTPLLGTALGLAAIIYLVLYFLDGNSLELNSVIMILLFTAILLFMRTSDFLEHLGEAAKSAAGVIVQYPLYAGIMAVLAASGLGTTIAYGFAAVSTAETLPLFSMFSGGFINLLVPSGGGQWAMQGPLMVEAARSLGADPAGAAIGVATGDMWTNMVHPFWVLPALGIAGLKLRDVLGFMLMNAVLAGVVLSGLMLGIGFGIL